MPSLAIHPNAPAASQSFPEWNNFVSEPWRSVQNSNPICHRSTKNSLWNALGSGTRKSALALVKWHFTYNALCYLHFSSLFSVYLLFLWPQSISFLHFYFPFFPPWIILLTHLRFFLLSALLFSWGTLRESLWKEPGLSLLFLLSVFTEATFAKLEKSVSG